MTDLTWLMPIHVTNRNLLELTLEAIDSFKVAEPDSVLLVVDDGSPHSTAAIREKADIYVKYAHNRGFSKSVNSGLRLTDTPFIGIVNNDIRVAPNMWKEARPIFYDPTIYSVHPRMTFYDTPIEYGEHTYPTGKERWCQTSCFFIRNNENTYRFPELPGIGGACEDWWYWSMVRRDGHKTAYTNKTCFQHQDSSTTQVMGEWAKKHETNREMYRKEFGDYPEEHYTKLYPEQMSQDWREGFNL